MSQLYKKLVEYGKTDIYPLHMPGHKRMIEDFVNPYSIDITEIDGFDNLHHSEDILLDAQKDAAKVFLADQTYYLINGSTSGILAAISACTTTGGKIIMARNCHKAAYHGVLLRNLEVLYTYPHIHPKYHINCGLNIREIENLLIRNPDVQSIFITSPTYEGIVSDVKKIANLAHERGIPLIVDEAHGAHFGFHEYFPKSANEMGADLVIQSLHKTLPSLTQTAFLHLNGNLVSKERVEKFLGIYQTSSPSYVMMSSMERCVQLIQNQGEGLFNDYVRNLKALNRSLDNLENIDFLTEKIIGTYGCYDFDPSKLVFFTHRCHMSGQELYDKLRNHYHLQMEMVNGNQVLGMTSLMDTEEGYRRLYQGMKEIDEMLKEKDDHKKEESFEQIFLSGVKGQVADMKIGDADEAKKMKVHLEKSEGYISGEFIYLYPPGIPILAPGEKITEEIIELVAQYRSMGANIQGLQDYHGNYILVVDEKMKTKIDR
ncbi:MAG TPA: aminotransferase class I/II-fold pyridoxal phosphate-dependent enzyme [Candidatus Merdenecus merdavium]|nr:aminotransferase class I/II-fold pyridoxal phosphate-dependent enzyme [Candidatus Merdenecus merdavium]